MFRHIALVGVLMTAALLVVGQLYLTIPLTPAIATHFAADPALAAWSGTAFGFAYAAGFLIWGPLSDRIGRRRVLIPGLVATGAATAALGQAGDIQTFLAGRALQGMLAASFPPVALSLLGEALPPQLRARAIALLSFAFLAAAPLAQMVAAGMALAPPELMRLLAPGYLLMALGVALALPAPAAATQDGTPPPADAQRGLLQTPLIVTGWLAALTVLFGFVTFQAGTAARAGTGIDPQVLRLAGLPPLMLSLLAAVLARRLGGPAALARIGLVLTALGLGLAGTAGATLLIAAVLVAAGVALAVPGLIATIGGAAAQRNRGLALAIYTFALFVGASLAPPAVTALAPLGQGFVYGLPAALLLVAAAGLYLAQHLAQRRAARPGNG